MWVAVVHSLYDFVDIVRILSRKKGVDDEKARLRNIADITDGSSLYEMYAVIGLM